MATLAACTSSSGALLGGTSREPELLFERYRRELRATWLDRHPWTAFELGLRSSARVIPDLARPRGPVSARLARTDLERLEEEFPAARLAAETRVLHEHLALELQEDVDAARWPAEDPPEEPLAAWPRRLREGLAAAPRPRTSEEGEIELERVEQLAGFLQELRAALEQRARNEALPPASVLALARHDVATLRSGELRTLLEARLAELSPLEYAAGTATWLEALSTRHEGALAPALEQLEARLAAWMVADLPQLPDVADPAWRERYAFLLRHHGTLPLEPRLAHSPTLLRVASITRELARRPERPTWVELARAPRDFLDVIEALAELELPGAGRAREVLAAQEPPPPGRYRRHGGLWDGWLAYGTLLRERRSPGRGDLLLAMAVWSLAAVDTGLHVDGWTLERAQRYLGRTTRLDKEAAARAVDEVLLFPGRALARAEVLERLSGLREAAERLHGASFDEAAYHAHLLSLGGLPLAILARRAQVWIDTRSR